MKAYGTIRYAEACCYVSGLVRMVYSLGFGVVECG